MIKTIRALMLAVLVTMAVASCASTVQGVGNRSTAVPPVPTALKRIVHNTSFGDPLRLEMCTGVDPSAFDKFGGTAAFDNWALFGGCFVDVYADRRLAYDVYAQAITDADFGTPDKRTSFGRIRADRYTYDDGTCRWLLYPDQFFVMVSSSTPSTAALRKSACAASALLASQIGRQLASGHLPPRRIPANSVSEYDMCTLIKNARVDRLPDIGAAAKSEVHSYYLGSECVVTTDTYEVTVVPVIDSDPVHLGSQVSYGGHPFLSVEVLPKTCRMASEQQRTGVGGAEELLTFDIEYLGGTAPASDLCHTDIRVGSAVLDAAELR